MPESQCAEDKDLVELYKQVMAADPGSEQFETLIVQLGALVDFPVPFVDPVSSGLPRTLDSSSKVHRPALKGRPTISVSPRAIAQRERNAAEDARYDKDVEDGNDDQTTQAGLARRRRK